MNTLHAFLFQPNIWLGEGKLLVTGASKEIGFYTKWIIDPLNDEKIFCRQQVELLSSQDQIVNHYCLEEITPNAFSITLSNELFGTDTGRGKIDGPLIAWEFENSTSLRGFEIYTLQENGEYLFHAEYASLSPDQFRTTIHGRIWKK